MAISEPTDQIFNGLSGDLVIDDAGNSRKLTVSNLEGWCDTVVWNPYGDAGEPSLKLQSLIDNRMRAILWI